MHKHNIAYKQKQRQKPHDPFKKHRKSLWQNPTPFLDRSAEETVNRRNVPHHSKSYV
jgi:hypothetical protein